MVVTQAAPKGLDRGTRVIAGVVALGLIMSLLDTTIVNVALDRLAVDLSSPLGTVQWVSTGYLLSLAVVIPLSGWAVERFGSKRVWLTSVALFGLGSALCGLSTTIGELITFRVLQGLGGGMLMPVGFALVTQAAGPARAGRVLSLLGVPILLGPICGPILGGLIVDNLSWHWIFFVNVPISILAFFLAHRVLGAEAGRGDPGRLDVVGAALVCPGLVGIVFGLSETQHDGGLGHAGALLPMLAGLALIAAFVVHALRIRRPLLEVRLFAEPAFGAAAATTFLLGVGLFGALLLLPLYYQLDRGESALAAGLLMAPQGIGAALALSFSGRLTDRIGGGPVVTVGATIATLATLPWAFVGPDTPHAVLALLLVVRGIGMGASVQPAAAAALAALSGPEVPRATAALNALRQVGSSIGTALAAVLLATRARHELPGATVGDVLEPVPADVRARIAAPLAEAFGHAFAWVTAASALAILAGLALWMAERRVATVGAPVPAGNDV